MESKTGVREQMDLGKSVKVRIKSQFFGYGIAPKSDVMYFHVQADAITIQ